MKLVEFCYATLDHNETIHLLFNWKDGATKCGRSLDEVTFRFYHDFDKVKDAVFCKNCMRGVQE